MVIIGEKKYDLQKLVMEALRENHELTYTALKSYCEKAISTDSGKEIVLNSNTVRAAIATLVQSGVAEITSESIYEELRIALRT
ncbi:MAG: hypothetical protein ACP5GD_03085 [Candidatus Micrarchaeia archaeon]